MLKEKNTVAKGRQAEEVATRWLEGHGLKILERNWRHRHLEIDIIASGPMLTPEGSVASDSQQFIHIVEVRSRTARAVRNAESLVDSTTPLVQPQQTVFSSKQKFLTLAADAYVRQKKLHAEVVFDIMGIEISGEGYRTSFFPDAFRPSW